MLLTLGKLVFIFFLLVVVLRQVVLYSFEKRIIKAYESDIQSIWTTAIAEGKESQDDVNKRIPGRTVIRRFGLMYLISTVLYGITVISVVLVTCMLSMDLTKSILDTLPDFYQGIGTGIVGCLGGFYLGSRINALVFGYHFFFSYIGVEGSEKKYRITYNLKDEGNFIVGWHKELDHLYAYYVNGQDKNMRLFYGVYVGYIVIGLLLKILVY